MDANINVAKIFSFRSDNSPRWAFRVDGTESGSNAGADFAIRRYTDAGAFIDAPLSIVRSTGVTTIKSLTLTNVLSVANGGTGATSFTAQQIIYGNGTNALASNSNFYWETANNRLWIDRNDTGNISMILKNAYLNQGSLLQFQKNITTTGAINAYIGYGGDSSNNFIINHNGSDRLTIASTGNITFSNNIGIGVSPSTALDVNGTINVRTNGFQFGRITTNNVSGDTGGLTFQYITGGTFANGIVLTGGGNVGIGTNSPFNQGSGGTSLEIAGSVYGQFYVYGGGATPARGTFMARGQGFGDVYLATITNSPLVIGTNDSEKIRIQAGGNVGIGTSTPQQKLDVSGAIKCGTGVTNGQAIAKANGRTTYKVIVSMNYDAGNGVRSGEWNVLLNNEGTGVTNTTQIYNYNGQSATFSVSGGNLIINDLSGGNNQAAVFTT
jgi:hypothetical protein